MAQAGLGALTASASSNTRLMAVRTERIEGNLSKIRLNGVTGLSLSASVALIKARILRTAND